jgi:hypothetical protein
VVLLAACANQRHGLRQAADDIPAAHHAPERLVLSLDRLLAFVKTQKQGCSSLQSSSLMRANTLATVYGIMTSCVARMQCFEATAGRKLIPVTVYPESPTC